MNILFEVLGISLNTSWEKFITEEIEPVFKINILNCSGNRYGIESFDITNESKKCFRYNYEIMFTDDDWKKITILSPIHYHDIEVFIIQAFYKHALYHNAIQMHCSIVDYKSNGLLFIGPSGIGKTTQAELWQNYKKATIINGDIGYIQKVQNNFYAWGTPWHGSSVYCENMNVPIKALIVLQQEKENKIRELKEFEKLVKVADNVFYPEWIEYGLEKCFSLLSDLLNIIPVYELSCRPDEEAVALTEQTIFGGEH